MCAGVCGCALVCGHVCAGVHMCVQCTYIYVGGCTVCAGVSGCVLVSAGVCGMPKCEWVCVEVCGSVRVSASLCSVLDEFSEYLLETRVNTSADFNTYPIRIFLIHQSVTKMYIVLA